MIRTIKILGAKGELSAYRDIFHETKQKNYTQE